MNNNKSINQRSEIVFLYDIKDANPNGDPMDENKPRMDEDTNIVTDVRLKRTIRDYISDFKKAPVFIKEEKRADGTQKSRTRRLAEFIIRNRKEFPQWDISKDKLDEMKDDKIENEIKNKISISGLEKLLLSFYIDIRLFGATIAVKNSTITKTGPVQFRFGRSLHKVEPKRIKGTTVMPSKEAKQMGTFTERYILPYSLICFYGIVNENAAKTTYATEDDVAEMLEGIWNGIKNLITESKIGQMPRFLLRVAYKEGNFHIGDLDKEINKKIELKDEKAIRNIDEIRVDITKLIKTLLMHKNKIDRIEYEVNNEIIFLNGKNEFKGSDKEKDILKIEKILKIITENVKRLNFEK